MKKFFLLLPLLFLAACDTQDPCIEAKNPVECRQWSDAGGDVNDYLLYGMAGYMIGSSMSGDRYIYRDTNYRGTYHPKMSNRYGSKDVEIKRLQAKVERQKVELRRQQAANARKKAEAKKTSSSSRKASSWSSRPSRPMRSSKK